jgi:hypothetical protein
MKLVVFLTFIILLVSNKSFSQKTTFEVKNIEKSNFGL